MDFVRNNIRRMRDMVAYLKNFHNRENLHYTENRNTIMLADQDRTYKRLEKEYVRIIADGVQPDGPAEKSNKVWICWLQGEENAPDLVKACIASMRKNLPDKEIIVLSEETIPNYVTFPDYINRKWKEKKFGPAHYSDLLRVTLLCEYGGLWADATVLCTSGNIPKAIKEAPLFVFKAMDLGRQDNNAVIASSWFISAWSRQPILLLTKKMLYDYWEHNDALENYFLFHILFAMACRRYEEDWKAVPTFNNHSPHTLMFELGDKFDPNRWEDITNISVFHKLNHHIDYSNAKNTFYEYIINNFLLER